MKKLSLLLLILLTAGCTQPNVCGIENCHGLDITCGSNIPEACTALYQLGDFCRDYANCTIIEGACTLETNQQFTDCKSCVNNCETQFDGIDAFNCESICREKVSTYCNEDFDCACGRNKNTGECFFGNKESVNTNEQCPDYCSGIAGNLEIKCIKKACAQVSI